MLENRNIVCLSSIDWDFVWQGHQEIMSILARNGNRVLFVENTGVRTPTVRDFPRLWKRFLNWKRGYKGIRKQEENLYIYSPLILPFPHSKIATKINRTIMLSVIKKWMKVLEFHNPIVWSFLPTSLVLDMLEELDPSIFIYYCIDDFVSSSRGARKIKKVEEKVIKQADLVFVTSHKLFERCSSMNKETHLFPFGVSIDHYNTTREKAVDIPDDMREIKKPIVGYIGGLHKWMDLGLLKKIALERKDLSVVLIGPKQTNLSELEKIDNVYVLGKKEQRELPNYVKFFDAGIIPYLNTAYTQNVYPTKINEYLAMGKPVISTRIREVVEFDRECGGNFIHFIENEKDLNAIMKDISLPADKEVIEKRITVANSNSWTIKMENMCNLITTKMTQIQNRVSQDWLKRLKKFYVKSRKRTIKIAAAVLVVYLVLFYSPLVWILASPLEISQAPRKAGAIVVFGGGVGETGSPGKSTIERARYSVDLFEKGYSKTIIFSSGYTFGSYDDASNMKLFAMSMGIPEENIVLEKKAGSTYENVKFTTEILRKKGINSILLVSAVYNTRRAALVYGTIAKDIKVTYCSVPKGQFYAKRIPIGLEQIRGILHEYLGILYYIYKGEIKL